MKFFAWFVFSRLPAECHLFEVERLTGTSRLAVVTRNIRQAIDERAQAV